MQGEFSVQQKARFYCGASKVELEEVLLLRNTYAVARFNI